MQEKEVKAYSLIEFCQQVDELLKQGYEFDYVRNENVPQMFGNFMFCKLVKPDIVEVSESDQEVKVEVQPRDETVKTVETTKVGKPSKVSKVVAS